jgi:hypothetical protein
VLCGSVCCTPGTAQTSCLHCTKTCHESTICRGGGFGSWPEAQPPWYFCSTMVLRQWGPVFWSCTSAIGQQQLSHDSLTREHLSKPASKWLCATDSSKSSTFSIFTPSSYHPSDLAPTKSTLSQHPRPMCSPSVSNSLSKARITSLAPPKSTLHRRSESALFTLNIQDLCVHPV